MKRNGLNLAVNVILILSLLLITLGCAQTPTPTTAPAATQSPKATQAKVYTLKVSSYGGGKNYPPTIIIEKFMELVKERSGGQIQFEHFPNSSLYDMPATGRAISSGIIQLGNTTTSYYEDKIGVFFNAMTPPFTYDWKRFNENYRKTWLQWLQDGIGKTMNWKILWAPKHDNTNTISKKPIRNVADFKGKLIRAAASLTDMVKLLGAEPVIISGAETFDALQRGTVDAAMLSNANFISAKMTDVAKYVTVANLAVSSLAGIMPLDYYNELPSDLRKIIDDAALEVDKMMNPLVETGIKRDLDTLRATPGVEVIEFGRAELDQLNQNVGTKYHEIIIKKYPKWAELLEIVKKDNMGL
ncbi:MAG: TRAP transporter substrate-binding protein DctP [Chloroflexi bacterium]|nr:TRAP transporter substrate-binding protein DctP [Chloroflexota bacterium]